MLQQTSFLFESRLKENKEWGKRNSNGKSTIHLGFSKNRNTHERRRGPNLTFNKKGKALRCLGYTILAP